MINQHLFFQNGMFGAHQKAEWILDFLEDAHKFLLDWRASFHGQHIFCKTKSLNNHIVHLNKTVLFFLKLRLNKPKSC